MNQDEIEGVFDAAENESTMSGLQRPKIGLDICKKICENLGGEMSVISRHNVGSRFKFTMKVMYTENQDVNGEEIEAVSVSQINPSETYNTSEVEVTCPELADDNPLIQPTNERRQAQRDSQVGNIIHFNGICLNKNGNLYSPSENNSNTAQMKKNEGLFVFLDMLAGYEAEGRRLVQTGTVVFADDSFINQMVMKMNMEGLGIYDNLKMYTDGMQTVIAIEETLNIMYNQLEISEEKLLLWPIPLLIVDINMPFDGLQVVSHIFGLYEKLDQRVRTKFAQSNDQDLDAKK